MIYGAILRTPVYGGAPDKVDDAAARAVAGVIDVVRLPYSVGVLAKTPWAAFNAKSALASGVTWQRSGKAWGFDSDKGRMRSLPMPAISTGRRLLSGTSRVMRKQRW